jgi:hypothetical protein
MSARVRRRGRRETSAPLSVNNEDPLVLEPDPLIDVAEHRALVVGVGFSLTSGAVVSACKRKLRGEGTKRRENVSRRREKGKRAEKRWEEEGNKEEWEAE